MLVVVSVCATLFGARGSLSAAPLEAVNTFIDVSINGTVDIGGEFPPHKASYYQEGHLTGFTSGDTQLAASVTAGNVPGCPHIGTVGSSTGLLFEQIAFNEYALTLTSTAMGQLLKAEAPGFRFGDFEGRSSVNVRSDFLILGYPYQQQGDASTILLELEHFGTLSSVNNGRAHNQTHIDVYAPGPGPGFVYDSFLDTPELPTTEFEWSEFIGTRNITRNWSILTYVGETINLSAEFGSDVFANLTGEDAFNYISANSDFGGPASACA